MYAMIVFHLKCVLRVTKNKVFTKNSLKKNRSLHSLRGC